MIKWFFIYIYRSTKIFQRVKWSLTGYVSNTDLRELNVTGSGIGLAQFPSLHPKLRNAWIKNNKQNEIVELIVEKLSYMDAKKTSKQIEIQSNFDSY